MERTLYNELKTWKNNSSRLPLVVRGARQVGKSFLIEQFGQQEFSNFYTLNFEKEPQLISCFKSIDPKNIQKELELQKGIRLNPGDTLLFLDEIQDCPQALKALRYFAEEMPDLHVIAAGSLLEFVLENKEFSFPVGRIQFMNLGPLSFIEYLKAYKKFHLIELLQTVKQASEISDAIHQQLLNLIREFLCVGGMPGVVSTFISSNSYIEVQRRQSAILDLYALDFGKYATKFAQHRHLKKLFERIPGLVGKHFKFSKIDPDCANPARDYREALNRLRQARLIIQLHQTKGNALPLRSEKSEGKFKLFLLDVGLLVFSLGWDNLNTDIKKGSSIFRGVVAEQFVAQEILALQDPFIDRGLFYWKNLTPSSSAEIDFLVNLNQQIFPIEVKSGSVGSLKSLKQFMGTKRVKIGIQVSENPLKFGHNILSIPFYLISELERLVKLNNDQGR